MAFCFVLPMDKYATAMPNIFFISLVVIFPFVVRKNDFKRLLKRELLLFAGLVAYVSLNNFLFHDFENDLVIITKIASSLLLVVLFIPIERTENLMKTVIASVLICILISLYNLYFFYMEEGAFNFASGGVINEVLIFDRLYLGFLCVISIIASIALIGEKYNEYNKWYFTNIVLCVIFVLLIASRVAILLLLLLFFLKIFYAKRKREYVFFFLGIVGLIVAAFAVNKNLNERFFYTHSTEKDKGYIELLKDWEPRFIIWDCNYEVAVNENPTLNGLGFYKTKDLLVACYAESIERKPKRNYYIQSRFNPHNQFVDFYLSTGILGFLLFGAVLVSLLRNRKSYYKVAFWLALAAFVFIESLFQRQLGAYLFSIVLIFIMYPLMHESNSNKKIADGED
jgi:O-antigen ligase